MKLSVMDLAQPEIMNLRLSLKEARALARYMAASNYLGSENSVPRIAYEIGHSVALELFRITENEL